MLIILGFPLQLLAVESTYALYDYHGEPCLLESTTNDTLLVCQNTRLFTQVLLQSKDIQIRPFIAVCPKELALRSRCSQLTLQNTNQNGGNSVFQLLLQELVHTPLHQLGYFWAHSKDDLIEDIVAIGGPFLTGYVLMFNGVPAATVVLVIVSSHAVLSPAGDWIANFIETPHEQQFRESEQEWQIGELISNRVEDLCKFSYVAMSYMDSFALELLKRILTPGGVEEIDGPSAQVAYHAIYYGSQGIVFILDTYRVIENYNWLNERSDALGDYVRDCYNHLWSN